MRSTTRVLIAVFLVAAVSVAAVILFSTQPRQQTTTPVSQAVGAPAAFRPADELPTAAGLLESLPNLKSYTAHRVSSYDTTGGNDDRLHIPAGATVTLADIRGAGVITHLWFTIAAEPFYSKKIILRMYWDGNPDPCVEVPLGDFFGVGHGLDRNWWSLLFTVTSKGRARNSFIPMPFNESARIEVTNEGSQAIGAFYYYIDYRLYDQAPSTPMPHFHAKYNQKMPNQPGSPNYVILDAKGRGHYIGCTLSVLNRKPGWWGEGDDMIYIDGESKPSLHGTGSEDYFCDAWGIRPANGPFYGTVLQEEGYDAGDKASVYRFHLTDPIPFRRSIRVTLEHGHANDRGDDWSSVAYWYQLDPHKPFGQIPPVAERLPFAITLPEGYRDAADLLSPRQRDRATIDSLLYYRPGGQKLSAIRLTPRRPQVDLQFTVPVTDRYSVAAFLLRRPGGGKARFVLDGRQFGSVDAAAATMELAGPILLGQAILTAGSSQLSIAAEDSSFELAGLVITPVRKFISDWYIIGPFDNPRGIEDTQGLAVEYPPEKEIDLGATYPAKAGRQAAWQRVRASESGYVDFAGLLSPNEYAVAYGMSYVYSPDDRRVTLLVGSDDGVRVWVNGQRVLEHLVKRPARPDQDRVDVLLNSGWNRLLIKVEQGVGGWGFYARIPNLDGKLRFAAEGGKRSEPAAGRQRGAERE